MPIEIDTPEGIAEFPDGMADDEIQAVLQRQYPTLPDVPTRPGNPLTLDSLAQSQRNFPPSQPISPWGDIAGQPDTAFTDALFNRMPTDVANVARAIPADVAVGLSILKRPEGHEGSILSAIRKNLPAAAEASGNIPAALMGQPLPIDTALAESAKESIQRGEPLVAETLGQVSQGLAATAPLLVGIGMLPKAAQAFASAGFSLDMIRHAPEMFKDYAEEINKPKEDQDPDKLAQLQSGIIQTFAFAPLAGAHAGRGIAEKLSTSKKIATELPTQPLERPANELAAQVDTPLMVAKEIGFTVESAMNMEGVAPEVAAQIPSMVRLTDRRAPADSPTAGLSFSVPANATRGQIEAEFARARQGYTPPVIPTSPQGQTGKPVAPVAPSVMANARLALDRPVKEPYSDTHHSISLQVAATEFPADMRQSVIESLPKELAEKIDSVQLFKGEVVPSNRGMSVPARVQITFKDKTTAQSAIDYFKGEPPSAKPGPSDWTNALESLKFKADKNGKVISDDPAQVFSLPHPDAIKQIGKQLWNDAIDIAIAGVKAGKAIRLMIDDALAHIKKNAAGKFDEAQARNNLESIFPKTEVSGEEGRMRKLSERGITSEKIPEPVREEIKGSPESYYRQQSLSRVEERVRGMSDAELGAVPKESDIYTAAKLEQATRLFDAGNSEAGYRVFQDLSTELTRLGQVINQAKLFQALRPEHVVTVVNKELVKAGKDPLTPEQAGRVQGVAAERIKQQADLQKATKEWTKDPTDANAVKAEKALTDANKAALDEQNLVNQFKPRSLPAIIKSILQGNLLVPMSHVANVVGNVNFMPFRAGVRTIASGIDILDSYLRNRPRQVSVSPIKGVRPAAEGLIKGVKQIPAILAKGTGEVIKGESRAGLHPLRAWVKQFAKNPDIPTVGGKIPFSERVNLAIEGTFGVPAEVMLRFLGAGDIPFSEMARSRLISEQARLSKLSTSDAKMAKNFPELFFDKAALDKINNETRGAVFQRHSKTLDHLLSWIKGRGDWFDLAVAFVAPYKLTPWNIVGEILSYNPLIAMGRTALEAKRGNIRKAEMNAAKVIVGSTLAYAGYWLYEKGLLSPSLDDKGEQQKARILAGEVMPPNHVNISGLKRAMAGGDPAFKVGDETVDIFRGGGLAGSMFYMMANVGRDAETKPEAEQAILSLLKNSTLEQARFGLNQSFLKGVTGLLDAVREGEADTYAQSLAGTVLSVPLPNTLSAISRAERRYKVDATDKNLAKQVENTVRTRLGFAGMDDYLPLKRGLWGEPMRETPENRNALVYHFFDISKNRQVTSDPVPLELYRLWRKTANTSVIPTPPDKTLTVGGETYLMNPAQRSRYAELIGTARRSIASQIVTNPEWHKLPDEIKIDLLGKVYDNGLKIGKAQFFTEVGGSLEKKPKKAGFK